MLQRHLFPGELDQTCVAAQTSLLGLQQREHPTCIVCSPHRPNGLEPNSSVLPDSSVMAMLDCMPILQSYPT